MLNRLSYEVLPAIGDWTLKKHGTVVELLHDIPYFLNGKLVPPLIVVNSILSTGKIDAGMSGGCIWEAFALDHDEYSQLVSALTASGYKLVDSPDWVIDDATWSIYKMDIIHGIPSKPNREIQKKLDYYEAELIKAKKEGNESRVAEVFDKLMSAASESNRLIQKFRDT